MKRPSSYNTRQSRAILSYMASLDGGHVTAGQIAEHFARSGAAVGLTTVYRHLNRLVESGMVRRYTTGGASGACYQYSGSESCREHFHMICSECGELLHLQCDILEELNLHLSAEHAFKLNPAKTVFYGMHEYCQPGKTEAE